MSARQVVEALHNDFVEAVTKKNYSFEDLCRLLGSKGLAMRPATLREYLGPIGKEKAGTPEARSSRKEAKPASTMPRPDRSRGDVSVSDRWQQQHAGFEEEV